MTDLDIQKSRHLLKHLEEEMIFLSTIVSQIDNLSSQARYVSSELKGPGLILTVFIKTGNETPTLLKNLHSKNTNK